MKYLIITALTLLLGLNSAISQKYLENYQTSQSYDLVVQDKMSDRESGKVYRETNVKARVYYNENGEFVIIEQLESDNNKPLEMSIIDFKNGTHILLKDKSSKNAMIKSYAGNNIPSYMQEDYQFELGKMMEREGIKITQASYTVADKSKVEAKLEISDNISAPNYLKWMPVIQHDLGSYFPLNIDYSSEGKGGMLKKGNYNATNFQAENPFNFVTFDLKFISPARSKEDRRGSEVYGK